MGARTGARGLLPAAALLAAVAATIPAPALAGGDAKIRVLSNRADLISGSRALIEIKTAKGVKQSQLRIGLRARGRSKDVTRRFKPRPGGERLSNLRLLRNGKNVLTVRIDGERAARAKMINHPVGGPVTSGPQIQPWVCQDSARDAKCNERARFEFFYKSEESEDLQPYDRKNPPADVETTTTDEGVEVPFIVRVEQGYQNRSSYKIATLYQPGKGWKPWRPQEQWNHKLLMTHGQGCGVSYGARGAPDVFGRLSVGIPGVDDAAAEASDDVGQTALAKGFAVMSTAMNHNGRYCNIAVQAESMIMAKERLIEEYGPLRYTIAAGCSGGAVTQQQVANAYPGIYQGLTPQCSYPDTLSPGTQFADYHLLRLYFEDPGGWGPGVVWTPNQFAEVEGHISHANAITADEGLFKSAINPEHSCNGVSDEERYDADTNPAGVRCDVLSYMMNVLGPRPEAVWSELEQAIGRSFAAVPFGNEGVQYGLEALNAARITPAQFVDLNEKIGGIAIERLVRQDERLVGDISGLRNAYRSGAFNSANNLDKVAIINLGGPDPGAAHDYSHSWWMHERLLREQGHRDNYVMWFGPSPIIGDPTFREQGLLAMDRWLGKVEKDRSKASLAEKIVTNKPKDLGDRCDLSGGEVPGGLCENPAVQTRYGTPRRVSGAGPTSDVGACRLRPIDRSDYPITLTDPQFEQLQAIFPDGVCDWTQKGRGQRDTIPWLSYLKRDGGPSYGGKPLGKAPKGSGGGWTSPAFGVWRKGR